jgi:hypothetical protein
VAGSHHDATTARPRRRQASLLLAAQPALDVIHVVVRLILHDHISVVSSMTWMPCHHVALASAGAHCGIVMLQRTNAGHTQRTFTAGGLRLYHCLRAASATSPGNRHGRANAECTCASALGPAGPRRQFTHAWTAYDGGFGTDADLRLVDRAAHPLAVAVARAAQKCQQHHGTAREKKRRALSIAASACVM